MTNLYYAICKYSNSQVELRLCLLIKHIAIKHMARFNIAYAKYFEYTNPIKYMYY